MIESFTYNPICGTWTEVQLCADANGTVSVITDYDFSKTNILQVKYKLSNGTITTTPPIGLICSAGISVPVVKQYNVANDVVGQLQFTDPDFLNIQTDANSGLKFIWVERDLKDQIETNGFNSFSLVGNSIFLDTPLNDGEVLVIKYIKII